MKKQKNLRDQIKSYEDACALKGIQPLSIDAFSALPENERSVTFSRHKIETVIEVLKEGKVFDWSDYDQRKWFPVFDLETYGDGRENDGFVLDLVDSAYYAITSVGARLCSFSEDDARHVATILFEDYKIIMR